MRRQGAASLRLGRILGIEVGVHASWLLIAVLMTLSIRGHFGARHPEWAAALGWGAAGVTAALFFASVVLHELAHSLVARRFGIPVRAILLFLFGGVAQIEAEPSKPIHELLIAIAGPLASFALAGLGLGLEAVLGADGVLGGVAGWLARVNLALGLFNLLPGFPLDGGRVLRGLLWWLTGSLYQATRLAAASGRALALLLVAGGVLLALSSSSLGWLWLAFLGWFLLDAARTSARQADIQHALLGVRARDLMSTTCPVVESHVPLSLVADELVASSGRRAFLVRDHGVVRGIVTASDLQRIGRSLWPFRSVADAMRPLEALDSLAPDQTADHALRLLGRDGTSHVPVMDQGRLVGVLSGGRLLEYLRSRLETEGHGPRR